METSILMLQMSHQQQADTKESTVKVLGWEDGADKAFAEQA